MDGQSCSNGATRAEASTVAAKLLGIIPRANVIIPEDQPIDIKDPNRLSGKEGETMTDNCKAVVEFLNCDYELFKNEKNREKVIARFNELTIQGKTNGFCPLIIFPSDVLTEILEFAFNDHDVENTPEKIAMYRQKIIDSSEKIDAAIFLSARLKENMQLYEGENEILGEFISADPSNSIYCYTEPDQEIIIAKIPVKNPWELAAWIPMGGWNECPTPEEQVAVFRYWYKKYGAVPAYVTHDVWEMTLTKPPLSDNEAEVLAKEQFAFCSDVTENTIRELASMLKESTVWYFWWD